MEALDVSLLAITRTLGLDADRLMTGEVMDRFVGPLCRGVDGGIAGCPFDIETLEWLVPVSIGAGIKASGIPLLIDVVECDSMSE